MNYVVSDCPKEQSLSARVAVGTSRFTLASAELSSLVPVVSLAYHSCNEGPEPFEANGKGPWLQGTLVYVWCTMCFASNWASYTADDHVHTLLVLWHILTQGWDCKCFPSSPSLHLGLFSSHSEYFHLAPSPSCLQFNFFCCVIPSPPQIS